MSFIFIIAFYKFRDVFYISIPVLSRFFRVPCWYSPTSLTTNTSSTTSPTLTSSYSPSTSPPSLLRDHLAAASRRLPAVAAEQRWD